MKNQKSNHVRMYISLGTQPFIKTTTTGKRMVNFVGIGRAEEGSSQPSKKWVKVISWGKVADIAAQHLHKGKRVLVTGVLNTREVKSKNGAVKLQETITANNIILLDSGKRTENSQAA